MTAFTGTIPTIAAGDNATVAANLATYRDALKGASEAWTSYGSGASWTASGSNPAIGNGTWAGAYLQVNKLVLFRVTITMGSSTTYGTGTWRVALPVTAKSGVRWSFQGDGVDTGVNAYTIRGVTDGSAAFCSIYRVGNPEAAVTSTVPHTWGNTDILTVQGSYEAA